MAFVEATELPDIDGFYKEPIIKLILCPLIKNSFYVLYVCPDLSSAKPLDQSKHVNVRT